MYRFERMPEEEVATISCNGKVDSEGWMSRRAVDKKPAVMGNGRVADGAMGIRSAGKADVDRWVGVVDGLLSWSLQAGQGSLWLCMAGWREGTGAEE